MEGPRVKTEGGKSGDGVIALDCGEEFSVMGMNYYNGCGPDNEGEEEGVDNDVEMR